MQRQGQHQRLTRRNLGGLGAGLLLASPALAAWPERPVRLVHGFGPGGNPDTVGRIIGARLGEFLGQPIVVEPRPGASGIPASEMVSRSNPDGYTLVILTAGHAVSAALTARLPYDPVRDFSFISQLTQYPLLLATRPDHPAADMAAMLAMARQRPRAMFWGSGGGRLTTQGLSGEMINVLAGTEITQVAYQSVATVQADLLAGRLDYVLETPVTLLPQIQAGRLRALAVTGAQRYAVLPNVPTLREVGVAGYEAISWVCLAGPPGLPAPLVAQLNAACARALAEPGTVARFAALGSDVQHSTPEAMRERVAADVTRWNQVVTRAGLERQ